MRYTRLAVFLMIVTVFVAACGDGETPTPSVAPTAEPVEAPTEAPVEEPTVSPTEEPVEKPTEAPTEAPVDEPVETTSDGGELAGTTWTLIELNSQPLIPTTEITAQLNEDGTMAGSSGCNNYSAAYEVDVNNITISSILAATTMMACPKPIMEQESTYLATLATAETFEISDDQLTLYEGDGNVVASFSAVSQDLAGTSWDVISYNNGRGGVTSLIIGTGITANFSEDGQLTGNAGCNDYFGPFEAVDGNITMGPFGTTRKMCAEPEGIMEQEAEFLAALETAATYSVDGMTMNMRSADGATVANFRRQLPVADLIITPVDISLDTGPLDTNWQAFVVPGAPYDESLTPGPMGMPAHIEVLFGDADPVSHELGQPIMYIIPVNRYREMWAKAGNDAVAQTMQSIQELNFVLVSPAPTSGYPALPFEEVGAGANDLAVQVGRAVSQAELNTTSATQDGYRFVGRWVQDPNPVTNQRLRYVYQGFTNDGVFLVSFWWPEATPLLPNDASEMPAEQMDAFNGDYVAYMDAVAAELNATSPEQWDPDIALLDAIVASLEIEGVTPSGLLNTTWQWTSGPVQPDSSEPVEIPDPSKYEVTYGSDGTINFTADCNTGSMTFQMSNAGMTGSILPFQAEMNLSSCGSDSLYEPFVSSLLAAQNYRVWAGGNEMELILPAGGSSLLFRNANGPTTPAAEGATVSGTVTNLDDAPIPEGATLTVQIQDTSLQDVAATVVGEQIIENPGQFPILYEVGYDPNDIRSPTYTMSARLAAADGSLLFINDTAIPVITNGTVEDVNIPVIQVGR